MLSTLLASFFAFDNQALEVTECKRKGVAAFAFTMCGSIRPVCLRFNGPVAGQVCTGEVGGCGCAHSELRLIMALARNDKDVKHYTEKHLLLYTTYSACDPCAHAIVESGLFRGVIYRHFAAHWPQGIEIIRGAGIDLLTVGEIEKIYFVDGLRGTATHDTVERWQSPMRDSGRPA